MQEFYIVLGKELGWDCVVGLFSPQHITEEELLERFPKDSYVIQEWAISRDLSDFE